jgi:outer membrane protein assembly factor BamE (lipoprotein component of BamABCDE complex)
MLLTRMAVVGIVLALAGCAPQGVDNPDSRISNLKSGKTTFEQVKQEFGAPLTDKVAADGTRTVTYAIDQQQSSAGTHIPVLGPFTGSVTEVENDLTMTFDKDGVLTSHSSQIKPTPPNSGQQ